MCARTDNGFFPISEVCDGMVSLLYTGHYTKKSSVKFWVTLQIHFEPKNNNNKTKKNIIIG